MAPKSVTFRRHDHLVSVLFGDLLSHSYNITFSMFLYLVLKYDSSITFTYWFCSTPSPTVLTSPGAVSIESVTSVTAVGNNTLRVDEGNCSIYRGSESFTDSRHWRKKHQMQKHI